MDLLTGSTIKTLGMSSGPLPFPAEEYNERLRRTREQMERAGIELLWVTNPSNLFYLTGYDAWSFYVTQGLLLAVDEDLPIWIGREQDLPAAEQTTFLPPDRVLAYGDEYVQSGERHAMRFVADAIRQRGWDRRAIGVELDAYYFTARSYLEIVKALPNAAITDADRLVDWLRLVKSPREVAYLRRAAQIVDHAMAAGVNAIKPGVRQCDAAAQIYAAQTSGVNDVGGDYTSGPPLIPHGRRSATPHLTWTDQPFQRGQITTLELKAAYRRYHAILGRSVFLGSPPPDLARLAEVVVDGLTETLAIIKPGVTCDDVATFFSRFLARHGIEKTSRLGYSIGIAYPPTIAEGTAIIRPGDRTVLEPNMAFHLLPAIWTNEQGLIISEPFLVTETGCEPLCGYPRRLIVKD
jgi:Xaa-Pro dipeptidase